MIPGRMKVGGVGFNLAKKRFGFEVLVQLSVATLFFFLYSLIFIFFLPDGISRHFFEMVVLRYWPILWLTGLFILTCLFLKKLDLRGEECKWLNRSDLALVLFPMGSIFQYLILNVDILDLPNALLVLLLFSGFVLFLSFLIPMIFPNNEFKSVLMLLGISVAFVLFNMPSLAGSFNWHRTGELYVQMMVFLFVFFILFLMHQHARKLLMIMIFGFVISGTILSIVQVNSDKETNKSDLEGVNPVLEYANSKDMARTPDIFLLTYDAYVENETMLSYGIDNSAQERFLAEKGFHVYRGVYSQGASTLGTMDRMLDLTPLVHPPRRAVSGAGTVQEVLISKGYVTYGIFNTDYLFTGIKPSYNEYYPENSKQPAGVILKAVFEGEFRFDIGFETVNNLSFLERKRRIMLNNSHNPKFLYTHTGPGHSQNSGKCLPNEIALFSERLLEANSEMKKDIEVIIDNNPNALIIVNGDHGPYLTKNCTSLRDFDKEEVNRLDIQDRFGAFLAIRWPEGAEIDHSGIMILQDVFPVVFSFLFGDDSFLGYRMPRKTMDSKIIGGVYVEEGVIRGGPDDGELLFLNPQ